MNNIYLNKKDFFKYGYCVVRNVLTEDEIEEYKKNIKRISEQVNAKVVVGIHNYKEYWSVIAHKRILEIVRKILGDNEIRYLYSAATRHEDKGSWPYSWHRDNPCRIFGVGADWSNKEIYNCVRVGLYLSSYDEIKSGLNVIPFSHVKKYTLANLLRIFHHKTKTSNNFLITKIRNIFEKIIGKNIKTNPGDCVFFLAHLMHAGIPPSAMRDAIFLTYGTDNIHAHNYINYWVKHRPSDTDGQVNEPINNVEEMKNFLKLNNIYLPLPKDKKDIDGVSIPK